MRKYILFSVFIIAATSLISAQTQAKYLAGAVPEVDGKVVFEKTITSHNKISESALFDLLHEWAKKNYEDDANPRKRLLLANPETKELACRGEMDFVFKRSALVLDQTTMSYQLTLGVVDGKCEATIRNIRYQYDFGKEKVEPAEEVISDEYALNKKKDKLNRFYDKFRIHTVDSISDIFASIDTYINGTKGNQSAAVVLPVLAPSVESSANIQSSSTVPGYRNIAPDKIPGNIIKLLGDWTLITSGTDEATNVMTASWGGLGVFWQKPVSFCFLNPSRYSVSTMDKGETYTISFYTEAYKDALTYCGSNSGRNTDKIKGSGLTPIKMPSGATAFSEAWMIFECRKIVAQPLSPDAVLIKDLPDSYTKDGYHKMYIGEILNVWIK